MATISFRYQKDIGYGRTRQAPVGAPQQRPAEQLDRLATMSHAEEEMLDIPAFLRRQAN
jgi:cell division protein FtsZ